MRVSGELDVASAPRLREAVEDLRASGWRVIALDVGGMTFVDSSGLAVLLEVRRAAAADGGEVAIAVSCPALERLLTVSKLERAVPRP